MTTEEQRSATKLAKAVEVLPNEKKQYILGYADGLADALADSTKDELDQPDKQPVAEQ